MLISVMYHAECGAESKPKLPIPVETHGLGWRHPKGVARRGVSVALARPSLLLKDCKGSED